MIRKLSLVAVLGAVAIPAMFLAGPAAAATCSATVESTDAMKFTTASLVVPSSCKEFTVTLKHTGKLPKTVMGHNFVVGKASDVAASKVIGGGESTTVKIPVAKLKAGEQYNFICTFPGHSSIMKGTLTLGS